MFCKYCGTQNEDSSVFCMNCGSKLESNVIEEAVPVPVPDIPYYADSEQTVMYSDEQLPAPQRGQTAREKKKVPVMLIIGIWAALVAVIVIVCVAVSARKTIDLNDYVKFEATGVDGYGRVNATIDWQAIRADYGDKISYEDGMESSYAAMFGVTSPVDVMSMLVSVDVQDNQNLTNGSQVSYYWSVEDVALNNFSCKVKYKDGTYKVSGLAEVGTFDAFADLDVEFFGIAPNGTANLNYTGNEISYYDFSCDKVEGLRNGDVVTVSINEDNLEYYAQNLGKVPAAMKKEYTVSGLSSYVSKLEEIPDDVMAAMDMQAIDTYKAYIANDWADTSSLVSFNYLGEYLLTAKDGNNWGDYKNQLYLIYKAQARNVYESFDHVTDVYWYITYSDLIVNEDGTMDVDISNYYTVGNEFEVDSGISNGWWGTASWYYRGYPSLDALYNDVVTAKLEHYNHVDNVQNMTSDLPPAEEVASEDASSGSEYILPKSNKKILKKKHLKKLTAEECKLARNEIYARHGRKFTDESIQAYFNSCSWYNGTIEPDDFDESLLSDIEIANRDLIVAYEKEMGYR